MALIAAATTLPPWFTSWLLNRWQTGHRHEVNLRSTIRLMVVGVFVQSPMAAILGTAAMAEHPLAQASLPLFFGGYLLIEMTSTLVFAPLGWLFMPQQAKKSSRASKSTWLALRQSLDWPTLAYVAGTGIASLIADSQGLTALARLFIYAAVLGPLGSSISRRPSASSVTLAFAATLVLGIRAFLHRHEPDLLIVDGLLPAWLMISVGAILLHVLNAPSAERWRHSKRQQDNAMKSDIPGLVSARALHRFLAKLTADIFRKPI